MNTTVVVTGMGVISGLGLNSQSFQTALFDGVDSVADLNLFDPDRVKSRRVAQAWGYLPEEYFSEKELPFYDRYAQFAVISAREAIAQAGLVFRDTPLADRSAILFGTGVGGQDTQDYTYQRLYLEGAARLHPFTTPKLIPSSAASLISLDSGITGPVMGITSACSSSGHAVAQAVMMLKSDIIDVAIVGGAEAPITFGGVKAWEGMRVLAKDCCRPFSSKRGGTILGEGGASLVLETLEHAQERGANILAEVVGVGMSSDAFHAVQPSVTGPTAAMRNALKNAKLQASSIDYINAHGTGTNQNDSTETAAIRAVFGTHADTLAVSSSKSMHAHTLGAASAIEAVATICALQAQIAPATINYQSPDPLCDLDYVTNHARPMPIAYALSNSFAFGGLNVSLIFSPHKAD
ncbi:MAG: nodulation protein E [Flavobacteriales bacterium]